METKAFPESALEFSLGPKTLANREVLLNGRGIGLLRGPFRTPQGASLRAEFNLDRDAEARGITDAFWKWHTRRLYGSFMPAGPIHPFGVIRWFDAQWGVGFIDDGQGRDILVHHELVRMPNLRRLKVGDRVEYEVAPGMKGLIAVFVQRLAPVPPVKALPHAAGAPGSAPKPPPLSFSLSPMTVTHAEIICDGQPIGELDGPVRNTKGVSFEAYFQIASRARAELVIDAFWKWLWRDRESGTGREQAGLGGTLGRGGTYDGFREAGRFATG